jgi:hypothetical protein
MTEKKDTKFQPGTSGNPAGRAPGSGFAGRVRRQLQEAWDGMSEDGSDGIRHQLVTQAKAGEAWAIRIVAERICPPIKASEATAEFDMTGDTLTDKAKGVIAALADGSLSPGLAAQLLQALGALAKVLEVDELSRRIAALEEQKP